MPLVGKFGGRGLRAPLFKALFHCSQCFPAGLGHKGDPPTSTQQHFKKISGDIVLTLPSKDVFLVQPVPGRQLSSVSSGGQALQPAVLGQPAAEAERAEGE